MFGLGIFEILFIAVLALLLIGPEQLPEVTRTLARFLVDIRRSTNALKSDFQAHANASLLKLEEDRQLKSQPETSPTLPVIDAPSEPQQLELVSSSENRGENGGANNSSQEKSSGEKSE